MRPERRFWFDLALALGGRTVDEWQEAMSSQEFSEWMVYAGSNPFGEGRMDWRFGMLASVMASGLSGKEFGVEEFMPQFGTEDRRRGTGDDGEERAARLLERVEWLNAVFGGEDRRG